MALKYAEVKEALRGVGYIATGRVPGTRRAGFVFIRPDGQTRVIKAEDGQRAAKHFDEAAQRWFPNVDSFKRVSTASTGFWLPADQELPTGVKAQEGWPCEEWVYNPVSWSGNICNRLAPELGGKCGVHAAADRRVRENAQKRQAQSERRREEAQRRAANRRRAEEAAGPLADILQQLGIMNPAVQATSDGVTMPAETAEQLTAFLRDWEQW